MPGLPDLTIVLAFGCPGCGKQVYKSLGNARENGSFPCPGCAETIRVDKDDINRRIEEMKSLDKGG